MSQITISRTLTSIRWVCVWILIFSQFSLLALPAAAQDPTPIPTPTPASSPTPQSLTPTPIPTSPGEPTPTPTGPTSTPTGRIVKFDDDTGDGEIDSGECVLFSWVVRGDIAFVEFDQIDDGKDPWLVSDIDEREECPTEDTEYQLKVTWMDDGKTRSAIEIEVNTGGGGGSGGGSGGGGGSTVDGGTVVPPGSFVQVTPILITNTVAAGVTTPAADIASSPGTLTPAPTGVLASVSVLPETGALPPPATVPASGSSIIHGKDNQDTAHWPWQPGVMFAAGLVMLSGSAVAGLALPRGILLQKTSSPRLLYRTWS